jgi:hypothetical protein
MRKLGALLLFFGIVACAIGGFSGCGALFTWNGKHIVAVDDVEIGKPFVKTFEAVRGRRYVAGVQIVFDRTEAPVKDGEVIVASHMPLVATMTDGSGTQVAHVTGWLDPNEPPTMLYGRSARTGELAAERLVGPWLSRHDETARLDIRLEPDRDTPEEYRSRVAQARVVLYDDRTPTSVVLGLVTAGVGAVSVIVGIALLALGSFRASRKRRDGISALRVV